jgi:uncharacterized membrane protein
MAPLIVMLVSWAAARLAGFTGFWSQTDSWSGALRVALAAMFVFTGVSHFHRRIRRDLIRMVPPTLPRPALLVTITGIVEFIGAAGLLLPSTATAAAYSLIGLLVAMFPANLHAARAGLVIAGRRAIPILWRAALQLFWIGALWCVARSTPNVHPFRR